MSISAMQSGLQGIHTGWQNLRRDAHNIASYPVHEGEPGHPSLDESAVNLLQDKHQVQASAKVIEAADQMIGTLLDVLA